MLYWRLAMGLYAKHIFPRLMDWTLGARRFHDERRQALASAHGRVLEIGFGTGLNLPHYPTEVTALTGVEPVSMLERTVDRRRIQAAFPVEIVHVGAEALPFESGLFDCVVSTWTMCSIRETAAALREIRRVLKSPGGFVFLEHGRSDDPRVAAWQDRLNPVQRLIACGCSINRRIDVLLIESGFRIQHLDRYQLRGVPRVAGEMYRGVAVPATPC